MSSPRFASLLALVLLVGGCSWIRGESRSPLRIRPDPVIQSLGRNTLGTGARIAIMPFHTERQGGVTRGVVAQDDEVGTLVANFFSESMADFGVPVVAPNEIARAFRGTGRPLPRLDPVEAAAIASRDFGAQGVALGRVLRYREREGSAAGSANPASVSLEIAIYNVETGRRMWRGRFDQTQRSLTENILLARQLPGRGTRWLTAAELARWGTDQMVRSLYGAS